MTLFKPFNASLIRRLAGGMMAAAMLATSLLSAQSSQASDAPWLPYPSNLKQFDFNGDQLDKNWTMLSRATHDPLPTTDALKDAWRSHFQGDFAAAKQKGLAIGGLDGTYVAYRAQTIYAMYLVPDTSLDTRISLLDDAVKKLTAAIMDAGMATGEVPSAQVLYWRAYAQGRYLELKKPEWGILTKKAKVKELFGVASAITDAHPEAATMSAVQALYGGLYAAIYDEGFAARLSFKSYVKGCGVETSDYATASVSQFNCALKTIGKTPFPEIYKSYSKALLQLDSKGNAAEAETYLHYAAGAQLPPGVTEMIFSAEDALARNSVPKKI